MQFRCVIACHKPRDISFLSVDIFISLLAIIASMWTCDKWLQFPASTRSSHQYPGSALVMMPQLTHTRRYFCTLHQIFLCSWTSFLSLNLWSTDRDHYQCQIEMRSDLNRVQQCSCVLVSHSCHNSTVFTDNVYSCAVFSFVKTMEVEGEHWRYCDIVTR